MTPSPNHRGFVRVILTLLVCALLLGGAAAAIWIINDTEPTAQQEGATRKSAALVETIRVDRGTYRPRLEVLGHVEPARDVMLSPRITGQVVGVEANFVPGGLVQAGETLLRIDPADFEHTLLTRRSELRQVQADLAIEEGRQTVARQEFDLLGQEIAIENRALILREPQIESLRAKVEAAQAAVKRAQLDLNRTTLTAPFAAHVLTRNANVGSQVSPGNELAHLVGIDEYWVIATVPLRDLRWLHFPDAKTAGARVRMRHASAWAPDVWREGRLERLIGTVDADTHLARVLISVPDPLGRTSAAGAPPLILGTLLQVEIEGIALENVVRIERSYVRQNDKVWVMKDGLLDVRTVETILSDARFAYIATGLQPGEQIVTTNLATVTNGLALRRVDAPASEPADGDAPR